MPHLTILKILNLCFIASEFSTFQYFLVTDWHLFLSLNHALSHLLKDRSVCDKFFSFGVWGCLHLSFIFKAGFTSYIILCWWFLSSSALLKSHPASSWHAGYLLRRLYFNIGYKMFWNRWIQCDWGPLFSLYLDRCIILKTLYL